MTASSLGEVVRTFLRLGLTTFGGPAAHVAMFRDELVARRKWLGDGDFLELLAASNLIPGPTSTELSMHIGHRRAGWPGLFAAGLAFAAPSTLIVLAVAWAYVTYGSLPEVGAVFAGIAPVVVVIVANATIVLGRASLRSALAALVAGFAVIASLAGVADIAVLLAGALAGAGGALESGPSKRLGAVIAIAVGGGSVGGAGAGDATGTGVAAGTGVVGGAVAAVAAVAASLTPLGLFLSFVKIGALLFGSGYLLVALLRAELVVGSGVLSEHQLLDAIAVGQFTPGPVFTSATFVGYLLLGLPGAIAATAGIALPAFVFVCLSVPILPRIRASLLARAALGGVTAAVVGLLVAVSAALARTALVDPPSMVLGIVAFVALVRFNTPPIWLIAAGALVGAARAIVGGG